MNDQLHADPSADPPNAASNTSTNAMVVPTAGIGAVPVQATPAAATQAKLARAGLLGIGAAALIAVAALAFGSSASPAGTLAAGTDNGNSNETVIGLHGGPGGPGGPGARGMLGGIEITAIDGSSLSLTTADGWTRTITVDDGTTYTKSGDDLTLADLGVGDEITFRQRREDDGSFTIDAIAVIPPHAGGEVTTVDGSTITVERRDGETTTIAVDGSTTYQVNGDAAALGDIEVGMFLIAEGAESADGTLTATEVKAADPGELDGRRPGPRGGHGFGFGPFGGEKPDASTAPEASSSAG